MAQAGPSIVSLVGCQHRQAACFAMMEDPEWQTRMRLEAEPDNQYDSQAVKVLYDDRHVGYLSKKTALEVRGPDGSVRQPKSWAIVETKFLQDGETLQWVELEVSL